MTNAPLSPSRKAAIRARAEQATDCARQLQQAAEDWQKLVSIPTLQEGQQSTIRLLREVGTDIPDLLAELDRLDAELARMRRIVGEASIVCCDACGGELSTLPTTPPCPECVGFKRAKADAGREG